MNLNKSSFAATLAPKCSDWHDKGRDDAGNGKAEARGHWEGCNDYKTGWLIHSLASVFMSSFHGTKRSSTHGPRKISMTSVATLLVAND